ncbi:hypothetical protein VMT65_38065 [Nocardia sp. CDC153]|uniref:hypothetical protein n=1 Tax=Nocardia sp. CDC153 TaxID=3112167 RepID=UPI002DB75489|nr:hypothetical protein [Nocardia sp. CDC153]MEC3958892.1 hypothetical protein [Nocardia sp. CDC153]
MQEAALEIEFIVSDVPELNNLDTLWSWKGLAVVESEALRRWSSEQQAFTGEEFPMAMRFCYFIGETFRREVEGNWVALPPHPPTRGIRSVIDAEYRARFYDPADMLGIALLRRTGDQLSKIFGYAVEAHREWVEAGRPGRGHWPGSE